MNMERWTVCNADSPSFLLKKTETDFWHGCVMVVNTGDLGGCEIDFMLWLSQFCKCLNNLWKEDLQDVRDKDIDDWKIL